MRSPRALYAFEMCGANSSNETSIESFTRVGERVSTALFTLLLVLFFKD